MENPAEIYKYYAYLDFTEASSYNVGRYYCVFTRFLKTVADGEPDKEHYDEEVDMNQASSIYVFVDGK